MVSLEQSHTFVNGLYEKIISTHINMNEVKNKYKHENNILDKLQYRICHFMKIQPEKYIPISIFRSKITSGMKMDFSRTKGKSICSYYCNDTHN